MKHFYRQPKISTLLLASVLISSSWALHAQETNAQDLNAEEAVALYVGEILSTVIEVKGLYDTDREQYFSKIETALSGFIDFREAGRGVMAKYTQGSKGATDEQLTRFAGEFKVSMVDFYGSALAAYNGEEYEMLPSPVTDTPDETANIRMLVTTNDGADIELQYSMYRNPQDIWKMRNLFVEGVNLRRQYHSRFDSMMGRYNYDIDAVIDNWAADQ